MTKKEEKTEILINSMNLLKNSASVLKEITKKDYENNSEKDFLQSIFMAINSHASITQTLLFNIMRLIVLDREND